MLDLSFRSNIQDILGALDRAERRHVPFALALALTRTAAEGQAEVREKMPEQFTLRRPWAKNGVRIEKADYRAPVPQARVYTMDWFMENQETGGTRTGQGGHGLFVPTNEIRKGGVKKGGVKKRPATLIKQAKKAAERQRARKKKPFSGMYRTPTAFFVDKNEERTSGLKPGIYIRRSSGPRKETRLPIVLLYRTVNRADVPARWKFHATLEGVADKRLRAAFAKALTEALAGGRSGPRSNWYLEYLVENPGA